MAWAPDRLPAQPGGPEPAEPRPPAGVALRSGHLAEYAAATPLQVLRGLDTTWRGLDEAEAQARLARHGDNAIAAGRQPRWGTRLLAAVRNPFVVILIILTTVSAATGDLAGAAVIAAMVVISCLVRIRQEYRSDRAAAALRAMVATTATVIRRACPGSPASTREVPVDQLVPGDLVRLAAGDMVPADLRLLRSHDLAVSQAVFTGESQPAAKRATSAITGGDSGDADGCSPPGEDTSIFDSPRLCFMGTSVVSGSGTAVVIATGTSTYLGATHHDLPEDRAQTAFDRGAAEVTWLLASFMIVCVPVVLAVNAAIRGDLPEALLFAVAVAVGLTPEMLPVVVTSALARGAGAVARRAAIVKRLPAMHNLGAIDVLCADKTGTLTEDRVSLDCGIDVTGRADPQVLRWAWTNSHWSTTAGDGGITSVLDQALLACGADRGLTAGDDMALADVIPFDFSRRRVTVITRTGVLGQHALITKGAPEEVLGCCARVRRDGQVVPLDPAGRDHALALADALARDGVRVLAVAIAARRAKPGRYRPADEAGLTLAGFVGFRDLPRESAARTLAGLAARGVAVKIMTGDHPLVAARVCRDVGIDTGHVVTGEDIARLDDEMLAAAAETGTVFARVDPGQKARLVRALRAAGHAVGFLGDGVNDAAALREADVGISVADATAVARECAEVILVRKDLAMLEQAIVEGRRSFGNVVKYLKITISSNFGNVLSMLAASAALPFLPMLPLQVLAQNLCFDVSQLSLAFDRVDESSLRGPRSFDRRDLARFIICLGPVNTLADLVTFAFLWRIMGGHVGPAGRALFRTGWFAENLLTQAVAVHLLRSRRLPSPRHHAARPVVLATVVLALFGLGLPLTPIGSALSLRPLPAVCYLLLAAVLIGYGLAVVVARSVYLRRDIHWP